jgi:hypothetical protein
VADRLVTTAADYRALRPLVDDIRAGCRFERHRVQRRD